MTDLADLVQKAFYLGVGLASYAGEKATDKLAELQPQLQQLADEMVRRGEMTTEEARQWVEIQMHQATSAPNSATSSSEPPRRIEILSAEVPEDPTSKTEP